MIPHRYFRKMLGPFMDKELSEKKIDILKAHLSTCRECRKELDDLAGVDRLIHSIEEIEPSDSFDLSFRNKISTMENKKSQPWFVDFFSPAWRPYLAAGALVILIFLSFIYNANFRAPERSEIVMAREMDMLKDYEIISRLDLLENWDVIVTIKERS